MRTLIIFAMLWSAPCSGQTDSLLYLSLTEIIKRSEAPYKHIVKIYLAPTVGETCSVNPIKTKKNGKNIKLIFTTDKQEGYDFYVSKIASGGKDMFSLTIYDHSTPPAETFFIDYQKIDGKYQLNSFHVMKRYD